MAEEYRCICKDCNAEFGYSEASIVAGATRGMTRPERCPACRRTHSRESRSIGIPQIQIKPIGRRKPDHDLQPGRLGKISHPKREHSKVKVESKFGKPDSLIDFGITDDDMCDLIDTMQNFQVTVVVGPTGSGKSTFLPYRLMVPPEGRGIPEDIFTRFGQIAITQPRTQATRSIAKFVSQDLHGSSLGAGFDVGFRHSGSPASDWRNKLVYLTDGTLINWIVSGQLANLSVIMIDEAHERSVNIDLILGLLKQQLPRYPHLKLIIASATINSKLFLDHFGGPGKVALLEFRGMKQFKVEAYFPHGDSPLYNIRNVPDVMAKRIYKILVAIKDGEKSEGDILGFLTGEGEINTCVDTLRSAIAEDHELRELGIEVLPLYTQLPQAEQDLALAQKTRVVRGKVLKKIQEYLSETGKFMVLMLDSKSTREVYLQLYDDLEKAQIRDWNLTLLENDELDFDEFPRQVVFTTHAHYADLPEKLKKNYLVISDRRVIISTNVAETSLTVDGIVYVVDSGLIKQSNWDPENSVDNLKTIFHSRAGCRQRYGRAGRVRDGEAHMLYTCDQFEDEEIFPAHTIPEIQRTSIEQIILKAKAAGIDDIRNFPWIQSPPEHELKRAPAALRSIGALDEDGDLTGFGVELQSFMTDVPIANLLVAADQYACGVEMATLAALLPPVRLQGGLLSWDRLWDFPTREVVGKIHKQLAKPCDDDLDFLLKLYSIWAEAKTDGLRSILCELFFISATNIEERVIPQRQQFLEMLSIGKKGGEDRVISFSTLDRLRIVLAASLPEHFIFTHQDGRIKCLCDAGARLPIEIDENSVLSNNLPPVFIALNRRTTDKDDEKFLILSCLIKIDNAWLAARKLNTLQRACYLSKLLEPFRDESRAANKRTRLFLDINYPLGASFSVAKIDHKFHLGQLLSWPQPVKPVFVEDKGEKVSFLTPDDKDVNPLAGWEDKKDEQVAYGPFDEDDAEEALSPEDFTEGELINSYEDLSTRHQLPDFCFDNVNDGTQECVVSGYDLDRPRVVFRTIQPGLKKAGFTPGQEIEVKGIELLGEDNQEKALLVETLDSSKNQSVIDAKDLSFSGRWFIAELYLGKRFKVKVVERQGVVRLTRLPCIEESIHKYIDQKIGRYRNTPQKIACRLMEKNRKNLYFIIVALENDGIYEAAHCRLHGNSSVLGKSPEIGKTYDLFFNGETGHSDEKILFPPKPLMDFLAIRKQEEKLFWNNRQLSLHTKLPMKSFLRESLAGLSDDVIFQKLIARLYISSNKLKLWEEKPRNFLERGQKAVDDRFLNELNELVPDYKKGDRVRGRVAEVYDNRVLVVLEKGGVGKIENRHLCWQGGNLVDPREIISADQLVECSVIKQEARDVDGETRFFIPLSMLDPGEFPAEYSVGNFHDVKICHVNKEKNFALAELKSGVTGIIRNGNLEKGQILKTKIEICTLDPLADEPVRIKLAQLPRFKMEIEIPARKIGLLIGKQGVNIKNFKAKTQCQVKVEDNGLVEITCQTAQENVDRCFRMIKELIPETKEKQS